MILFRPVGLKELELIVKAGHKAFPPRLPEQPIFYPVLNLEYAAQIARDWNSKSSPYAGFVTRFEIEDTYAEKFDIHTVGSHVHQELWVPAEELDNFNQHILTNIEVVASYFGDQFDGDRNYPLKVRIHFIRPGKETAVYTEGLIEDDGYRLKTFSIVPEQFRQPWSQRYWEASLLLADQKIYSVAKFHFYGEWFTIMELRDEAGDWLGTYCDIATPLQKIEDEYQITDLFLDVWITPSGDLRELDWDEFEQASTAGLLSLDLQERAKTALVRLRNETAEGKFPSAYMK